jgi:DHA1 family inner membrane transport protein
VRWLGVFALALGEFGTGTTEFAAMGLLPDIAGGLGFAITDTFTSFRRERF